MTQRTQKRLICLGGFWLTFIFVTSSLVVPFETFVHFVQGLSNNLGFKEWFASFWLVGWFVIVKGWHATEFAILIWIIATALHSIKRWNISKSIGSAFAFAVLFALSDEWHQSFVPGRDGCLRDVLIDVAGAALAMLFLWIPWSHRESGLAHGATPR